MASHSYFSPTEKNRILKIFSLAQALGESYFRILYSDLKIKRYEIRTLLELDGQEVKPGTFAYLCKYAPLKEDAKDPLKSNYFYRICLQDDQILEALNRGGSFIKFSPLMLYIAMHELVHIFRFNTCVSDFDMPPKDRLLEEERVHTLTQNILKPVMGHELKLILDCFSNNYLLKMLSN